MDRIRTGIAGYGMAGSIFHAPLLRALDAFDLAAVSTSRPQAVPPGVRGFASAEELVADPDLDLIVVATPNCGHFPLAEAALRAGKHVVVDKPFTLTTGEADALIALAARRQRLLTVFHNRRWDGDFLAVRGLLESARLGEVKLFEAHWDRFRPAIKQGWREVPADGAGLLADLGPHLIDQALLLFGTPDAIWADIEIQREAAAVDDYFVLTLHYGAMRAVLAASTLVAQPRPRFALHGTGGSYVKYGLDPQEAGLRTGEDPHAQAFGAEAPEWHGRLTCSDGAVQPVPTPPGRYLAFYEAVAEAVLRGGPPPVEPAEARQGLRLIELARRSAAEGRRIDL